MNKKQVRLNTVRKAIDKKTIANVPIIINLSNYERPDIKENVKDGYIFVGQKNDFYKTLINRRDGSVTNGAVINGIGAFISGKGLKVSDDSVKALDVDILKDIFPKKEIDKVAKDYATFYEGAFLVIPKENEEGISTCTHIPREYIAPWVNDEGVITHYGYCPKRQWGSDAKKYPIFKPKKEVDFDNLEIIESVEKETMIYVIRVYKAGQNYVSLPDYLACLPFAQLEEEIGNFSINHIKKGLSAGYIINFNNGQVTLKEDRDEMERKIRQRMTGSTNAGDFIASFNDNVESKTTIDEIPVNASHKQWEFWDGTSKEKILTAHRVTSPILFGIRDGGGLGNNSEEMETALEIYLNIAIKPIQEDFLTAYQEVLEYSGYDEISLDFIPLFDFANKKLTESSEGSSKTNLSKQESRAKEEFYNELIELGEDIDLEEWTPISTLDILSPDDVKNDFADKIKFAVKMAKTFSSSWKWGSEQDNELFKVRYKYMPETLSENSRDFCVKMVNAGKVYRKEDIISAGDKVVNKGFGPRGADTYSIWFYKGGVYCKHFFQRVVYLRKNNTNISVNEAIKIINSLDPSEREKVRLPVNDKKVAQVAEEQNNFWKLKRVYNILKNYI